jgi:hypothetical protein
MPWPEWWEWELEYTPHLEKRMVDRSFTEVDLREMVARATRVQPSSVGGRWRIETRHRGRRWEVIVEPDVAERILVVVTAYPVERQP